MQTHFRECAPSLPHSAIPVPTNCGGALLRCQRLDWQQQQRHHFSQTARAGPPFALCEVLLARCRLNRCKMKMRSQLGQWFYSCCATR